MRTCGHRGQAALLALSRKELQGLAKREDIKANLKSELIINRLLQKYPEGYPRSLAPSPELSMNTETHQTANVEAKNTPAGEEGNGHVPEAYHDERTENARAVEPGMQTRDLPRPELKPEVSIPTKKNLRFIRRETTELVDETGHLQEDLEDLERVLQMNLNEIDTMVRDANELVWMRVGMEVHIASKMKQDRTVWDGTLFMSKSSRRKWMQYTHNNRMRGGDVACKSTDGNEQSGDEYELYSIQS